MEDAGATNCRPRGIFKSTLTYIPGFSLRLGFAKNSRTRAVRVFISTCGKMESTRPRKMCPGYESTVTSAGLPGEILPKSVWKTWAFTQILERSATVYRRVSGCTYILGSAVFSVMYPETGDS